jgi:NAD-dependent dihydropyrimidine dehydrogenase PreA subunit
LGNCSRACPHDALHIDPHTKLPVVVMDKCIGCGLCVGACPRGVLALIPASAKSYIACRNTDKGAKVKKFCKAGCLACSLCVRACPSAAIRVADNLAVIDYSPCANCPAPLCLDVKCAPHVILPFPGAGGGCRRATQAACRQPERACSWCVSILSPAPSPFAACTVPP